MLKCKYLIYVIYLKEAKNMRQPFDMSEKFALQLKSSNDLANKVQKSTTCFFTRNLAAFQARHHLTCNLLEVP